MMPRIDFSSLYNHGTISLSPSDISKVTAALPPNTTATSFKFQIQTLNLIGKDTTESSIHALTQPAVSDSYAINTTATSPYKVDIPGNNGQLPPINFTAGIEPGILLIYFADTAGEIEMYDSGGQLLKSFAFNCPTLNDPFVPLVPFTVTPSA